MLLDASTESPGEDTTMENLGNDIRSHDTAEDEPEMLVSSEGSNEQPRSTKERKNIGIDDKGEESEKDDNGPADVGEEFIVVGKNALVRVTKTKKLEQITMKDIDLHKVWGWLKMTTTKKERVKKDRK